MQKYVLILLLVSLSCKKSNPAGGSSGGNGNTNTPDAKWSADVSLWQNGEALKPQNDTYVAQSSLLVQLKISNASSGFFTLTQRSNRTNKDQILFSKEPISADAIPIPLPMGGYVLKLDLFKDQNQASPTLSSTYKITTQCNSPSARPLSSTGSRITVKKTRTNPVSASVYSLTYSGLSGGVPFKDKDGADKYLCNWDIQGIDQYQIQSVDCATGAPLGGETSSNQTNNAYTYCSANKGCPLFYIHNNNFDSARAITYSGVVNSIIGSPNLFRRHIKVQAVDACNTSFDPISPEPDITFEPLDPATEMNPAFIVAYVNSTPALDVFKFLNQATVFGIGGPTLFVAGLPPDKTALGAQSDITINFASQAVSFGNADNQGLINASITFPFAISSVTETSPATPLNASSVRLAIKITSSQNTDSDTPSRPIEHTSCTMTNPLFSIQRQSQSACGVTGGPILLAGYAWRFSGGFTCLGTTSLPSVKGEIVINTASAGWGSCPGGANSGGGGVGSG